ncbi:hypothetical protein ACFQY4_19380 [Catellatospora bangladeshensis]|uniref:hypothetical protein n=1 Tax=Catellatospora bangladeshensis TaxID=310355 RepID=UPI003622584A
MSALRRLLPGSLTGLTGLACALCCLIPLLLAAGLLGGAAGRCSARSCPASPWPWPRSPAWRGGGPAAVPMPPAARAATAPVAPPGEGARLPGMTVARSVILSALAALLSSRTAFG